MGGDALTGCLDDSYYFAFHTVPRHFQATRFTTASKDSGQEPCRLRQLRWLAHDGRDHHLTAFSLHDTSQPLLEQHSAAPERQNCKKGNYRERICHGHGRLFKILYTRGATTRFGQRKSNGTKMADSWRSNYHGGCNMGGFMLHYSTILLSLEDSGYVFAVSRSLQLTCGRNRPRWARLRTRASRWK